jgi:DNA polymerase
MNMHNKDEIIKELRMAMEFYSELGFEYLPLKKEAMSKYLTENVGAFTVSDASGQHQIEAGDEHAHDYSNKEDALRGLREEIGDCQRCKLCKKRKSIVFGEGSSHAHLMFVGEGPGRDEDIQGRPFVGEAGKLLTKLIEKLGMRRDNVYIANIVKCRPPHNRNPEEDEIATCRPFVEKQIEIIEPRVIVCLGKIAAQSLLRLKVPISRMRGAFQKFNDISVMPTFHPAYLLRNPEDKWLTWDDMQQVMEKLE